MTQGKIKIHRKLKTIGAIRKCEHVKNKRFQRKKHCEKTADKKSFKTHCMLQEKEF